MLNLKVHMYVVKVCANLVSPRECVHILRVAVVVRCHV